LGKTGTPENMVECGGLLWDVWDQKDDDPIYFGGIT